MTAATIAERVAAGAAFLDEHDPGWWEDIKLDILDLGDCDACVLGQLFGHYDDGVDSRNLSGTMTRDLGFAEEGLFVDGTDYPALTAEWKRVITARRAGAPHV